MYACVLRNSCNFFAMRSPVHVLSSCCTTLTKICLTTLRLVFGKLLLHLSKEDKHVCKCKVMIAKPVGNTGGNLTAPMM